MADSSSSSSSITSRLKYDVFLSFRGEDTRDNFTSHLHKELLRKKIETFTDDRLAKGDEIPLELTKAIQQSKISIVIFSKNYAFSSWCLDELVHILECKERNEQFVIPVFYCVNPSNVRKQEGSYATAFALLEERFKDKMDKVHQWKNALTTAGNLCGWDSKVVRPESKLIEKIVGDVLKKLEYCTSSSDKIVSKGLVGIDKRVKKIETLLGICSPRIRIVGIWGMGGIGKSTLASVVFNRLCAQFESSFFLANVREESEKHGLISLRNKLIGELLRGENPGIRDSQIEPTFVNERLRRKKVLIVLDDVNKQEQLECLARNDWFCAGSKVIVTTRDIQLLRAGADEIYEVEELDFEEALQLFHINAFGRSSSSLENYVKMSKRIVTYTRGNPLALKVLGSYLRSRTVEEWECALNKLKVVPNMDIHKALRISYDGLDDVEKDIFLDIACFFKGNDKDFVERILDGCGFFACLGIRVLMDKSLITIEDHNKLWMHDLIQEMGWEVVRQQSIKEPGKRSRLWIAKDVCHVFKNNTGRYTIEGISLDKSKIEKDIYMHPTAFIEMYNLRLLQIYSSSNVKKYKIYLPHGLQFLPDSLRYLNWSEYPLRSLPSSFTPENLVALDMSHSQLEQLWDGIQNLSNLKHINLSYSKNLTQIPDLSQAPNLESINLLFCTSLFEVASHNIQNLHKLTILRLRYCEKLSSLPDTIYTRALRLLDLYGCSNLKKFPEIYGNLESLQIGETAIEELSTSILSLNSLSELDLKDCKCLKNLPSGMLRLTSLKNLNLHGCSSLENFPELPKSINKLSLSCTAIEQVPSSIEYLCNLEQLLLSGCTRLVSLPISISKLKSLKQLDLSYCSNLIDFPDIVEPMEHLITLKLQGTGIRELPASIDNLVKLQDLFLNGCKNLEFVPNNISNIGGLKLLDLSNCSKLENLPSMLVGLSSLTELHMSYCNILDIPNWLIGLTSLEYLDLSGTTIDKIATSTKQLSMLKFLYIQNCKNLQALPELPLSISFLDARGCTALQSTSICMATLKEGCWDDYHVIQNWQLSFYECTKLDQNEHDNMTTEFQFRVLSTASTYLLKVREVEGPYAHRAISICYPRNEIPKWFNHQCDGSSIDVKLSPNWNNDNFMGFALCAIVSFEDNSSNCDYPIFSSEFCFKTDYSESEEFEWSFYDNRCHFREEDRIKSNTILRSDHVFMCYELSYHDENYRDYFDATEVSFNFFLREYDDDYVVVNSFKVKRCGIRMLYLHDAEEFGITNNHYGLGKSNSTSADSEQCEAEMVDSNYKRRRLHY